MWDIPKIPLQRAVPLYTLWCLDHASDEREPVFEYTIGALNKYARAKDPENKSQNFRFNFNENQIKVVQLFLEWCKKHLMLDYEPVLSRAIKNWENAN